MQRSEISERIGRQIRDMRRAHPGVTLRLAANFLEVSVDEFEAIERGSLRATAEQVMLLADLLNVEPSCFFEEIRRELRVAGGAGFGRQR